MVAWVHSQLWKGWGNNNFCISVSESILYELNLLG